MCFCIHFILFYFLSSKSHYFRWIIIAFRVCVSIEKAISRLQTRFEIQFLLILLFILWFWMFRKRATKRFRALLVNLNWAFHAEQQALSCLPLNVSIAFSNIYHLVVLRKNDADHMKRIVARVTTICFQWSKHNPIIKNLHACWHAKNSFATK